MDIYVGESIGQEIVQTISEFALKIHATTGILTVESVDTMVNLNTGRQMMTDQL